ncbi:MAG TPA: ABC transporter substrate-binding protein [Stellaceae bacterium]|nr:ABC transporter substrate-binding protein [Stellaceae bacterium]
MFQRSISGLLALLLLGAFAGDASAQSNKVTVAVGGKTIIAYLPLPAAYYHGDFKSEGLDVDIQDVQAGPKAVEALVGGSADMVYGAIDYAFLLQPKGVQIKSIFLGAHLSAIVLGLPPDKARAYKGPADLKGMTIGVTGPGGAAENMLRIILAKGGLTLNDVTSVGVGSGSTAIAAMETGKIQGISLADPVITRLTVDGFILPVVDTRTLAGQTYVYGGPAALAGATTTADYVKTHADTVQRYVTALVKAVKWLHTASNEEIIKLLPPEFYGGDKDIFDKVLTANRDIFTADGRTTAQEQQIAYQQVLDTGRLAKSQAIDMAAIFDSRFVDRAAK